MNLLAKALVALAVLAFVLAVVTHFAGPIVGPHAEAYSRACSNLALLAIALIVVFGRPLTTSRSSSLP